MPRKTNVPANQARKEGKPMAAKEEKKFTKLVIRDTDGTAYTLQFNARVVKNMERRGFKIDTDYPNSMIEDLWMGAFQMHHKSLSPDQVKALWKKQTKKDELLGILTQLYMMPLEDLMAEPEGEEESADPTWETV